MPETSRFRLISGKLVQLAGQVTLQLGIVACVRFVLLDTSKPFLFSLEDFHAQVTDVSPFSVYKRFSRAERGVLFGNDGGLTD